MTEERNIKIEELMADRLAYLCKASVPIFSVGEDGSPLIEGTGFFVAYSKRTFLVSAAHVLDRHLVEKQKLYIFPSDIPAIEIKGNGCLTVLPSSGKREDDLIDVGILEINPSVLIGPNIELILPFDALRAEKSNLGKKIFLTVGYPKTRINKKYYGKRLSPLQFSYWGLAANKDLYISTKLDPAEHILIPFDRKNCSSVDGHKGKTPDPDGISGSPVWLFVDSDNPEANKIETVAGVITELDRVNKCLVATTISPVLEMISTLFKVSQPI
jgi:hypothetical protein